MPRNTFHYSRQPGTAGLTNCKHHSNVQGSLALKATKAHSVFSEKITEDAFMC